MNSPPRPVFDPPPGARPITTTETLLQKAAEKPIPQPTFHVEHNVKKFARPWLEKYRFKKGEPPPKGAGRTKKKLLTKALDRLLEEEVVESDDMPAALRPFVGLKWAEVFAMGLALCAVHGQGVAAFREARETTEGKLEVKLHLGRMALEDLSEDELKAKLLEVRSAREADADGD